jgi:Flp pilus assembly protein TadG
MQRHERKRGERGAALMEFAIAATVFFTALFGVIEFGRLLWTHNALRDAARRGARYAAVRKSDSASQTAVKNMVVYGDPNANPVTAKPIVVGLTTANVVLEYQNYNGIQLSSRATVSITGTTFKFAVPLLGGTINLPAYRTSSVGESAGNVPCDMPSATPWADCGTIPN